MTEPDLKPIERYLFRTPWDGTVLGLFRSGRTEARIWPRGMGSVTQEEYYTAEDVAGNESLQRLVEDGRLVLAQGYSTTSDSNTPRALRRFPPTND